MAIQLTAQQQAEFLKTILGEDVELVDAKDDFDINSVLGIVDKNRSPFVKASTSEEEKETFRKQVTGQMSGQMVAAIKRATGVDVKRDVPWEESLSAAIEHIKTLSGTDKDAFLKQLQDVTANKDAEREKAVKEWEEKYNGIQRKYLDRDAVESLRQKLQPMTLEGDKGVHASDLYEHLNKSYHVQYDEATKEIKLFNKDNPNTPAMNKEGTQLVSLDGLAKEHFTVRGIYKTDTRGKDPMQEMKNRMQQQPQQPQPFAPSNKPNGLAALQQGLDAMVPEG